jgi:nickel superoxide dismutase
MLQKITFTLMLIAGLVTGVSAHCEIPCGIYDDSMRIDLLREHTTTIEKSMKQITELSSAKEADVNQLNRWIQNKEEHADKLQEIVTQYFMTQRVKSTSENYEKMLVVLHQLLVDAMQVKQSTDIVSIENLRKGIAEFEKLY